MTFLGAEGNAPFTIALIVMLGIAFMEGVSLLIGAGLFQAIDNLLPAEIADPAMAEGAGSLSKLLSWLRFGQVPALMLLVIFLTAFGLAGLAIQGIAGHLFSSLLPGWLASLAACFIALPVVRSAGELLARIMPRDETESVSEASFIGRVAVVTLGTARKGNPAQARLRDEFGQTHYVLVVPDEDTEEFSQGQQVILVSQHSAIFHAIRNTSAALVD